MQRDQEVTPPELKPCPKNDGLGINRLGNAILCFAWGETDRPGAELVATAEDVRRFLVVQAFGDDKDSTLDEWMQELATHDWMEDGELKWGFEIGGVTLQDVCVDANTRPDRDRERLAHLIKTGDRVVYRDNNISRGWVCEDSLGRFTRPAFDTPEQAIDAALAKEKEGVV